VALAITGGKAQQEDSGQHEHRSEPATMQWTKLFHDLREVKLSEVNVNELTSASSLAARFTFLL
jgi:hypothetical protein